jgi:hypothetical protein
MDWTEMYRAEPNGVSAFTSANLSATRKTSMHHLRRFIFEGGILLLILAGCATWPDTYLNAAVNHTTQDDVAQSLGPPLLSQDLSTGGTVWSYTFADTSTYGCSSYILTFDREKILRGWQWQPACPQGPRISR